jgi:hypothetical protein
MSHDDESPAAAAAESRYVVVLVLMYQSAVNRTALMVIPATAT